MAPFEKHDAVGGGPPEDELVMRACAGCAASLEVLLARSEVQLRQSLTGLIPSLYRSSFDVDDLIQVTFIEAFLHIGGFTPRGPGSVVAWLTRMARNNLTDAIRGLRREKRVPPGKLVTVGAGSNSHDGFLAALAGTSSTPSRRAGRIEAKERIEQAIAKLPPDYAKVVRLMDLDGKTAPQAAVELGRSTGAVYMLQARAHTRLRELLGASGNFFSSGS